MVSETPLKLPIIDFSKGNLRPGTNEWDSVRNDVQWALEECGCFEAIYDNVTMELHNAIFGVVEELFNLPMETKLQNVIPNKPYFSYLRDLPGDPLYESLGIDDALVFEKIQSFTNIMFSQGNASVSEILDSYTKRVTDLEKMVKRMVLESLGVDKYYNPLVESSHYLLRFMRYKATNPNEITLGVDSHTDKTYISILHQNQVNGLEVQTKYGEWIQVTPSASSFIVMVGDLFHAWCNGRLCSARHRVMITGNERRYSIGLFSYTEHVNQCPEELVDEEHPIRFKPFNHMGYLNFAFTEEGREAEPPLQVYSGV